MQVLCPSEIKIQRKPNFRQKSLTVNSNSFQTKISQSYPKGVRPERHVIEFITFIQVHRRTVEQNCVCGCLCVCMSVCVPQREKDITVSKSKVRILFPCL